MKKLLLMSVVMLGACGAGIPEEEPKPKPDVKPPPTSQPKPPEPPADTRPEVKSMPVLFENASGIEGRVKVAVAIGRCSVPCFSYAETDATNNGEVSDFFTLVKGPGHSTAQPNIVRDGSKWVWAVPHSMSGSPWGHHSLLVSRTADCALPGWGPNHPWPPCTPEEVDVAQCADSATYVHEPEVGEGITYTGRDMSKEPNRPAFQSVARKGERGVLEVVLLPHPEIEGDCILYVGLQ